jgi:hypothetical protein
MDDSNEGDEELLQLLQTRERAVKLAGGEAVWDELDEEARDKLLENAKSILAAYSRDKNNSDGNSSDSDSMIASTWPVPVASSNPAEVLVAGGGWGDDEDDMVMYVETSEKERSGFISKYGDDDDDDDF